MATFVVHLKQNFALAKASEQGSHRISHPWALIQQFELSQPGICVSLIIHWCPGVNKQGNAELSAAESES
jgi:hypothetical protein